jgi:hypothetical protein
MDVETVEARRINGAERIDAIGETAHAIDFIHDQLCQGGRLRIIGPRNELSGGANASQRIANLMG